MSYSYKRDRGKNVPRIASPAAQGPIGLNVLKRDGSIQPFDKSKLVTSISKAGATKQQANLVSDRVVTRLGGFKQPVSSSQLSGMVARSLSRVNPVAANKYTSFRDNRLRNPQTRPTQGEGVSEAPSAPSSTTLNPAEIHTVTAPTLTLPPSAASPPPVAAAPTVSDTPPPAVTVAPSPSVPDEGELSDSTIHRIAELIGVNDEDIRQGFRRGHAIFYDGGVPDVSNELPDSTIHRIAQLIGASDEEIRQGFRLGKTFYAEGGPDTSSAIRRIAR